MRKSDYGLVLVIGIMAVSSVYFVSEWYAEQNAEMMAAREAADSWSDIDDCDMMLGKLVSLSTEKDFIGKDIIYDAINKRMGEVC